MSNRSALNFKNIQTLDDNIINFETSEHDLSEQIKCLTLEFNKSNSELSKSSQKDDLERASFPHPNTRGLDAIVSRNTNSTQSRMLSVRQQVRLG